MEKVKFGLPDMWGYLKYVGIQWYSPREPHALAWGPSNSHTKIFRVERARLKTMGKSPIPYKFCTYRFIKCPSTCQIKFRIDPLRADLRNPDCFASPVVNAAWFVLVRPYYMKWTEMKLARLFWSIMCFFLEIGLFRLTRIELYIYKWLSYA